MTENYTTLSNVYSKGQVKSKLQGLLIGSFDTMPTASQLYEGQTVIYTGQTDVYIAKHTYQCQETDTDVYEWVDITAGTEISVTANRAIASDQNGNLVASTVTDIELGYLDGVTSQIQTQLNNKTAKQASKGSATKGIYTDSNGAIQEMTYSVSKDVPSDAVFTDTTYTQGTGLSQSGTTINHSNSVTAETTGVGSATAVPIIKYDAQGHVTEVTTATIYPPTTQGTSGQVWVSDGDGAGVWTNQSQLSVGSASTATSATSATSAGSATNDSDGNTINTTYFKVANMYTTSGQGSSAGISQSDPIAMKGWVNSSIATNTANFLGTYDAEDDLDLTVTYDPATLEILTPTNADIQQAIPLKITFDTGYPTNNDYLFISLNESATTDVDEYRRFKYSYDESTSTGEWLYEYTLNNSSFTSAQWDAINSGITANQVTAFNAKLDSNNIVAGTSFSLVKYDSDGLVTDGTTSIPTSGLSGQVSVSNGGTGTSALTAHNVVVGNGTSQVTLVQPQSGAFYATGNNVDPTFGTLPVAQGGTGQTSLDSVTVGKAKALNNTQAIGGTTQPVYVDANGTPQQTSYSLAKSVPQDAVFTDTTYTNGNGLTLSNGAFAVNTSYTTSGTNYKVQVDSGSGGLYVSVPWSNTDTQVTQTATDTNGSYPILFKNTTGTTTVTDTQRFGTGISANPSASSITATTFIGALTGTASYATGIGSVSTTIGGSLQPLYVSNGAVTACGFTVIPHTTADPSSTSTDSQVPTSLAVYNAINSAVPTIDKQGSSSGSIITSSSSDNNVPSSKAVYNAIDNVLVTIFGGSY